MRIGNLVTRLLGGVALALATFARERVRGPGPLRAEAPVRRWESTFAGARALGAAGVPFEIEFAEDERDLVPRIAGLAPRRFDELLYRLGLPAELGRVGGWSFDQAVEFIIVCRARRFAGAYVRAVLEDVSRDVAA